MRISLKTKGKSRFFLLHQNAMNMHKAAKALSDLMTDFTNVDAKAAEVAALCRLGDEIAQQTSLALHDAPPPRRLPLAGAAIDRRAAAKLTHRLHGMTAAIGRAAAAMPSEEADGPPEAVTETAASIAAGARELEKAIGSLSARGGAQAQSLSWAGEPPGRDDAVPARWQDTHRQLSKALESGRSAAEALRAAAGRG